jgi:diguanylate cyclase (GGDEF)-like protein/PAS domain S-box-containing protein
MSKQNILVIGEDSQLIDLLTGKLLPAWGYNVLQVKDHYTVRDYVKSNSVTLAILEMQLTEDKGLSFLRLFSHNDATVPSIVITNLEANQVPLEIYKMGVFDVVNKPVEVGNLNKVIGRALAISELNQEKSALHKKLEQQIEWTSILQEVGQSVTSTLDINEVLRRIVEAGVFLTRAEEGFLALFDQEIGKLFLRAAKNITDDQIETMRLPVTDSLLGTVLETGHPYRSLSVQDDPLIPVSTGFLVHSLLHVPLISKGKPLGVLSVDNRSSRRIFTEEDERKLLSLADYATVALENANFVQLVQSEIEERRRIEQALRESEERYEIAVRGANDGLWDWNLITDEIYFSPRWKHMLGYDEGDIGNDPDEWFKRIHPEDVEKTRLDIANHINDVTPHFENEHRMLHKDGSYRWMLSRGIAVKENGAYAARMAGSQADIHARKQAEDKLLYDAFYDSLTNLPNRALFLDRLQYAVERAKRKPDYLFAVLFLDLDRFKDVNDSLGHMSGDELLVIIAERLRIGRRSTDTVARHGGDEFVILLEDVSDISDASQVANQIINEMAKPIHFKDQKIFISTSIGIVLSVTGYNSPDDILRDADIAMYSAKANGRNRFEIFDKSMRDRIMRRLAIQTELRQAVENQELQVNYQPIVSLENGHLVGFEALVRWEHPTHGLLYPADFIPLAEETGVITLIDRWVLRKACNQIQVWLAEVEIDPPLSLSVNISPKHFNRSDFVDEVAQILDETGLDPKYLKLEITESTLISNIESTSKIFTALQKLGVQIQIDDFGVGYSSLSYLSTFPIDALKIDQSFVSAMMENENQMNIIQTIVQLTQRLGVGAIAEGVETENQLLNLLKMGCQYGQGYLVSFPLDSDAVMTLLHRITSSGDKLPLWIKDSQPEI